MRISYAWTLLITLAPLTCFCETGTGGLHDKLRIEVAEYSITNNNFAAALAQVAGEFKIPMGIEWVARPAALKTVNKTWKRATVGRIIESLIKDQAGYQSEVRDGVLHVFPEGSMADQQNFLNIRIERFEVKEEFVGMANRRLRELVKRIVCPPLVIRGGGGFGSSAAIGTGDQQVSFQLQNRNIRGILDELILGAGYRIWVVTFSDKRNPTPTGFRRTSSPDGKNIPDTEQPIWQLLAWGQLPYM